MLVDMPIHLHYVAMETAGYICCYTPKDMLISQVLTAMVPSCHS